MGGHACCLLAAPNARHVMVLLCVKDLTSLRESPPTIAAMPHPHLGFRADTHRVVPRALGSFGRRVCTLQSGTATLTWRVHACRRSHKRGRDVVDINNISSAWVGEFDNVPLRGDLTTIHADIFAGDREVV